MNRVYNHKEWLVWEEHSCPMFLTLTFNAAMKHLEDYIGLSWPTTIVLYESGQARWLNRWQDLRAFGQRLIDFLMCLPYHDSFLTALDSSEQSLLQKANEIQHVINFKDLTNDQLMSQFDDLSKEYYLWYAYGWFCEPISFCIQNLPDGPHLITDAIEAQIKKCQISVDPKQAAEALFTSEQESFSIAILEDLLRCAEALDDILLTLESTKNAENAYHTIEMRKDKASKTLLAHLNNHSQKYYWKENNYFSTYTLSPLDVLSQLLSMPRLENGRISTKIAAELEDSRVHRKQVLKLKYELLNNLPLYYRNLAVLGSSFATLQDRRKRTIMIANSSFDSILFEVARRTELPIALCRQLIPQELGDFMKDYHHWADRLEARQSCFLVYQGDFSLIDEHVSEISGQSSPISLQYSNMEMKEPFTTEGEAAQQFIDQLNSRLNFILDAEHELRGVIEGTVAYSNPESQWITGRVRIIRDPKTERLEEGEILVAPSTTPDYLEVIRRSKAIVTDWGGQTSHAAIVSRELKKPCIIGTKFASQILSNGEIITLQFPQGTIIKEKVNTG